MDHPLVVTQAIHIMDVVKMDPLQIHQALQLGQPLHQQRPNIQHFLQLLLEHLELKRLRFQHLVQQKDVVNTTKRLF